jgi:hypothetical protein
VPSNFKAFCFFIAATYRFGPVVHVARQRYATFSRAMRRDSATIMTKVTTVAEQMT